MALIGKIRNNSWLLILSLGLALAAFIIMDMTAPGDMAGGPTSFTIGTVAGEDIDWRDFQRAEDILYSGSGADLFERRDFLWDYFVEKTILNDMAPAMGLGVGEAELEELQFGTNLSPIIRQRFADPMTGQVDRNQLNEFRQGLQMGGLDPGLVRFWRFQQQEIITQRLMDKLGAIVHKGIYTPTFMAEDSERANSTNASIEFVNIPFSVILDGEIEVSDTDIRNYIRDNRRQFERKEETRRLAYVTFDIFPTPEDTMIIREQMNTLRNEFIRTDDDSAFVEMNFGYFDAAYFRDDQLSSAFADRLFTMEPGEVTEPFVADGNYNVLKLVDRKMVPDSVQSRHILRFAETPTQLIEARELIDSLKNLIETGVQTFDSLAVEFGMDATAVDGGDLGFTTPGQMVKPFNDLIFYKAEPGQLYTVTTQFGVHLVEVTDRKFTSDSEGVRFAAIEQPIMPSDETQSMVYDEVLNFMSDNRSLDELRTSTDNNPNLFLTTTNFLSRNDFSIQGLGANSTSRDIIRWAFSRSARVGNVSPEIYGFQHPDLYFTEKYVVVALEGIEAAGLPSVSSVRSSVLPLVLNKKKGQRIAADIEGMSLEQISNQYNIAIEQANDFNLGAFFVPGLGDEPAVIGSIRNLSSGQQSNPIIGNSGVFSLRVTNKVDPPVVSVSSQARRQLSNQKRNQVGVRLMESIKEQSDIEDRRYTIY